MTPYGRAGRAWVLNKRPDGACVFLGEDSRCKIHAEFGEDAKPLACRMFPFSVRPIPRGWQASLRFDCPSAAASDGEPLDQARTWLKRLTSTLDRPESQEEDLANLKRGLRATVEELDAVTTGFARRLASESMPVLDRMVCAARITATLAEATLQNVRGDRFAELLDLLFESALTQCAQAPLSPTKRQRGMLRQLVFAHAEHVSLAELRSGMLRRLGKRWQQLRSARRFLRGMGNVPRLPGVTGDVTFEAIEAMASPPEHSAETDDMLTRYVLARLSSRSVFGEGYYGWPVLDGLTALWLSVAAAGWLARYQAALEHFPFSRAGPTALRDTSNGEKARGLKPAARNTETGNALEGRATVAHNNLAGALGIVDRAATRLPALGVMAERVRVMYLTNDDGVARLVRHYVPLGEPRCS